MLAGRVRPAGRSLGTPVIMFVVLINNFEISLIFPDVNKLCQSGDDSSVTLTSPSTSDSDRTSKFERLIPVCDVPRVGGAVELKRLYATHLPPWTTEVTLSAYFQKGSNQQSIVLAINGDLALIEFHKDLGLYL